MQSQPVDSFARLAHEVFSGYVRSAVIIDDAWEEPPSAASVPDSPFRSPEGEPSGEAFDMEVAVPASGLEVPILTRRTASPDADAILLRGIRDNLVGKGVITYGFRYQGQNDRAAAHKLAANADVVVLDWHLAGTDSSEALEVLRGLRSRGGLHFVCIFSGQIRPPEIRQELVQDLGPESENAVRVPSSNLPASDLRLGNLVISIGVKPGIEVGDGPEVLQPESFLDQVLYGLAEAYGGLVQLAMLEMTSRHRNHLPRILERVQPSIDAAVLFEAGQKDGSVGAGGAFLSVLVDEWRAHLELEQDKLRVLGPSGRTALGDRLKAKVPQIGPAVWVERLKRAGAKENEAKAFAEQPKSSLEAWLAAGCGGVMPISEEPGKEWGVDKKLRATWEVLDCLAPSVGTTSTAHATEPLLRLDAFFHEQMEPPVRLAQGTVVSLQERNPAVYLICITPLCDAVRPARLDHVFTFLLTKVVPNDTLLGTKRLATKAHCVVSDQDRRVCLEILLKQRLSLRISAPGFDGRGEIRGFWPLPGTTDAMSLPSDGLILKRVAQLRLEQAVALTSAAAADAARVGVNRVELIRRQLGGSDP